MKKEFSWVYLIVAIVALTAFATANHKWGKWLFALIIASALLLASDRLMKGVE